MGWAEVQDDLDWPAVEAFSRYWNKHPPVHVMVAAYLGIGKGEATKEKPSDDEIAAFLATIPQVTR